MLDSIGKGVKPTVDFLPGGDKASFPEDIPEGKLYDIILFIGCRPPIFTGPLKDHEKSIDLLSKSLKKHGVIIVTETEEFIRQHISAKHYDDHKHTVKIEGLLKGFSAESQEKKEEIEAKIAYWNTKFKAQQTKKEKYILYQHLVPKAQSPAKEDRCKKVLEKVKEILSAGGAATKLMEKIQVVLKAEQITATIGRKGTAKKTTMNTTNINALGGEEACKEKLRAIKMALQDTVHTAAERVNELLGQAGLQVRANKTAKASNSAKTPDADFFSLFDPNDPSSRDLATLNEVFRMNLLDPDAVYDKEAVETAAVLKSGAEKTTFSVEEGKAIKQGIIREKVLKKMGGKPEAEQEAAVQEAIQSEATKSLADFTKLYAGFEGNCADVKISLECMHASGSNSDCFFHSFFGATCEFYRMAKVKGKAYNPFVTRFRKEIVPQIIRFVFQQADKPSITMSEEDLIEELGSPHLFLPDDLYSIIAYYYNCAILLIRPKAPDGIRVAPLIGENTEATYGISNSAGVHFEPLRIMGQNTYKLSGVQAKCLSYTYSQLSGSTSTVDSTRFKEMGKVIKINVPGGDGVMVYDEAAMLDRLSEGGEIRKDDEPGDVTRVYMGIKGEGYDETKTGQVRKLQELIGRLTKNYKDRQLFQEEDMAAESQELEESIQLLQQGMVDGNKADADITAKEAEVVAFVARLTPEEEAEERARKAKEERAAKAAKAKAEKAAKKGKGGRRTVRKERAGRKTPRA